MENGLLGALRQYINDALPGGSLNREVSPDTTKSALSMMADFTPIIGDIKSAYEGIQAAQEGDWLGASLGALGALPVVPNVTGTTVFRGIKGKYDPNFKQPVEWWSEGEQLARGYGDNLMKKDIPFESPVDLGFRTYGTEVKLDDVLDRLKRVVIDQFHNKNIPKEKGMSLMDKIEDMRSNDTVFKPVYQWLRDIPELPKIIKDAGHDSIKHIEEGTQTYGKIK